MWSEYAYTPAPFSLQLLSVGGHNIRPPVNRVGALMKETGAHTGPYRQHWAPSCRYSPRRIVDWPYLGWVGLVSQMLSPLLLF
jgi:hypothetical protein